MIIGVILVPIIYAGFLFFKFFQKDSSDTRADLQKACVFVAFSLIAQAVWFIIYFAAIYSYPYNSGFIYGSHVGPYVINAVVYLYYAGVCKRYAKQWGMQKIVNDYKI